MSESKMSLVKVLSAEPLPLFPVNVTPEVDKYVRDLHNYLRRLLAKLTAQNIWDAIITERADWLVDKWIEVKHGLGDGDQYIDLETGDVRGKYLRVAALWTAGDVTTWRDTHFLIESSNIAQLLHSFGSTYVPGGGDDLVLSVPSLGFGIVMKDAATDGKLWLFVDNSADPDFLVRVLIDASGTEPDLETFDYT